MTKDDRLLKLPLFAGSVAAALFACDAAPALAQQPVSPLVVKAQPTQGYAEQDPSLVKLTQPIIDTPQMISTTSQQMIQDRAATSLTEAFRNSSGISIAAGESSWQGTNLSIRGFNARNDIYLDGMRDFGSYTRDPFDLEEVELLQGPSSMLFGRGSTGGVINQVTKAPTLDGFIRGEVVGGTDSMARGTVDIDGALPSLGQGSAFRLDAMAHRQDVTDRDKVEYSRYGVAPSLAFGLGTSTRAFVSYFYQQEDDIPDYGLPYLRGAPAPVARDTFYGFDSDFLHTQANVATGKVEHDYSSSITIRDQVRYGWYQRHWRDTEPQTITTGVTAATPLSSINVTRALQGGHSVETMLQNQMDLVASFKTGTIEHNLVAGWEIGPESSKPTYDNGLNQPVASLVNPNENLPFSGVEFPRVKVSTTAMSVGAYAVDTVKLNSQWELTGGIRFDRFDSHYQAQFYGNTIATLNQPTTAQDVHQIDQQPSYRASIVYKPQTNGSIYFDYSTSFNPSAEALSQITAVRSLNVGNIGLAPEKNETFEGGTKWNLLANRLQFQAAVFIEKKDNAREPDPTNSQFNILAGTQQVYGAEVEAVGQITQAWNVSASATWLDGQTIKTVAPGGPPVGSPIFNAPKYSVALWTTYQLPYRIQVGGGVNYMDRRFITLTSVPYNSVPDYTIGSIMVKWQATPHIRLQVNVNNIADAYYIDQVHGFHALPGEGRTALFTLGFSY